MDNPWDQDEDAFEGEETGEGSFGFSGKTALIAIIDASSSMFRPWGDNDETPFMSSLKCITSMCKSKMISNPNDFVSILFTGTENSKNSSDFKNLYVFNEMRKLTVRNVDILHNIVDENSMEFFENIGSDDNLDLKDVFWLAKIIFEDAKTDKFDRKILYFTCNDDPTQGNSMAAQAAAQRFKDLGNVQFEVVTYNDSFDMGKFYKKYLDLEDSQLIRSSDADSLFKVVRMRQRQKRAIANLNFEITNGISIAVGVYKLVGKITPPKPKIIQKTTNEIVETTTNVFISNTGIPVLKSEIVKSVNILGESAVLTTEEVKESKYVYDVGIKLIGFLKMKNVQPFKYFRSTCGFLYPDDKRISGSKEFFANLLSRCNALQKVPLVRIVSARGRTPKIAVLLPSMGEKDIGPQVPQGFHIFFIPFADEIRSAENEGEKPHLAPDEMTEKMEMIVKKLTQKSFDLMSIPDPSLQFIYRYLEDVVFNQVREEVDDPSLPNDELIAERVGDLTEEVKRIGESQGQYFRKAAATSARAPKRPANLDMKIEAENQRVEKLTIPVLTEFLESKGFQTFRKKKAELVSDVYNYFLSYP